MTFRNIFKIQAEEFKTTLDKSNFKQFDIVTEVEIDKLLKQVLQAFNTKTYYKLPPNILAWYKTILIVINPLVMKAATLNLGRRINSLSDITPDEDDYTGLYDEKSLTFRMNEIKQDLDNLIKNPNSYLQQAVSLRQQFTATQAEVYAYLIKQNIVIKSPSTLPTMFSAASALAPDVKKNPTTNVTATVTLKK